MTIAKAVDAAGREHDLPIAEKDVVVEDEEGVPRQLVKDQPVPLHLVDAYEKAVGKGKSTSKAVKAPEKDKAQRSPETDK